MRLIAIQDHLKQIFDHDLSMTVNLDEDIALGSCRISHLMYEKRIMFDPLLKNCGVYLTDNYGDLFQEKHNIKNGDVFYVSCDKTYIMGLKKIQWVSLDKLSDSEMEKCHQRISDHYLTISHQEECQFIITKDRG